LAATGVLGSRLSISNASIATSIDSVSEYSALTWIEIGLIESVGEFGKVFDKVIFQAVADGRSYKLKGGYDPGSLQITVGEDLTDTGQFALRNAAEAPNQNNYGFRLVLNDGTVIYLRGLPMGFRTVMGSVNAVMKATASIEVNGPIVRSLGVITARHYAPGSNFDFSNYDPGVCGFNLADVSDVATLDALPTGVMGLMWVGNPNGVDSAFTTLIASLVGHPKLFGLYLADIANPDPLGTWGTFFDPVDLAAQVSYIHANLPGIVTFMWLANLGADDYHVDYVSFNGFTGYTPASTGVDYFGIGGYAVVDDLPGGYDLSVINNHVAGALAAGIPYSAMIPTYQCFGGGAWDRPYSVPTANQLRAIITRWATLTPTPAFDYAYSWGVQNGDESLAVLPDLQAVMTEHNTGET
jgi:hypothetical protein